MRRLIIFTLQKHMSITKSLVRIHQGSKAKCIRSQTVISFIFHFLTLGETDVNREKSHPVNRLIPSIYDAASRDSV